MQTNKQNFKKTYTDRQTAHTNREIQTTDMQTKVMQTNKRKLTNKKKTYNIKNKQT